MTQTTTAPFDSHLVTTILLVGPWLAAASPAIAQTQNQTVLWVDPVGGSDRLGNGRQIFPVKTIGRALELADSTKTTLIRLEPGSYGARETFPIVLPPTVSLQGDTSAPERVAIQGGGSFETQAGSQENIAIVATGNGTIQGLAISNPNGIGVWVVGDGNPVVSNNVFSDSAGAGLAIATAGTPVVTDNRFVGHEDRALSVGGSTDARIGGNTFAGNNIGISISDVAMPRVENNRLQDNRIGIEITGITRPVLRGNEILDSRSLGIEVTSRTPPNLGTTDDPGRNIIRDSAGADVLGLEVAEVVAAGNGLTGTSQPTITAVPSTRPATAPTIRRGSLPSPVEKFRDPAPKPRANGAVAIHVPPPETAIAPPAPRTLQQEREQVWTLRSQPVSGPVATIPVPPTQAPSRHDAETVARATVPPRRPTPIPAWQAAAQNFRVLVEAASFQERARVAAIVPEAFSSTHNGRRVMQVGVFDDPENVREIRERLERFGFKVEVIPR